MKHLKDSISIRSYRAQDADAMRHVCVRAGAQPLQQPNMKKLILTAFCDYYIEQEPSNCFVAVDVNDQVVGYILCAENAEKWRSVFQSEYIERETAEQIRKFLEGSCASPLQYAKEYPAHLHIDILPQYQRMGLGTRLMDVLVSHLKNKGVPGLMLSVSSDNEKGIGFYTKYGFSVLATQPAETVMGLELLKKEGVHT